MQALKIGAAYIGTVIGAGFASGQEVLLFFCAFGWWGLAGLCLSSALFFAFGYMALVLGRNLRARSYMDVVRFTNGKILGTFIDIVVTVFLFGGFAAMLAGAGAVFSEEFGLPAAWGTAGLAIASLLTVLAGTKGVLNANGITVPFLIACVLAVATYALFLHPFDPQAMANAACLPRAAPNWLVSALNYVSYNFVIALAVLAPMGAAGGKKPSLRMGALLGGIGLGLGMLALFMGIFADIAAVRGAEIPMLAVSAGLPPALRYAFAAALLLAIYTTGVGNLYGFSQRTDARPLRVAATAGAAFLVSRLGFSALVRYLYPAIGYCGILLLIGMVYARLTKRPAFK